MDNTYDVMAQIATLSKQLSDMRTQVGEINRLVGLLFNSISSLAATTTTVSSQVTEVSAVTSNMSAIVTTLPMADYTTALSVISQDLGIINTNLLNIENAIVALPHDAVFDAMTQSLVDIKAILGTPPLGQNIWSRLSTITTVTTAAATAQTRVYGVLTGDLVCPININVYECLSNNVVASSTVNLADGSFEFYVNPAARYVVEFAGSAVKTVDVTIDVPSEVKSFNMTAN